MISYSALLLFCPIRLPPAHALASAWQALWDGISAPPCVVAAPADRLFLPRLLVPGMTPTPTATATTQLSTPTPTPQPAPRQRDADLYNCGDFATQAAAQACYNCCVGQGAGDVHRLDADGDGVACEGLPVGWSSRTGGEWSIVNGQ